MMKSILIFINLLILICLSSLIANATIRYVKPTATGSGSGVDWQNASGNLQAMIDASTQNDEVWVMSGTYKPANYPTNGTGGSTTRDYAFSLKNGVKVYGGFVGNEISLVARTVAVIAANPSILNGDINNTATITDDVIHVIVSVSDNSTTILDGFTVTKGNASGTSYMTIETKEVQRNTGGGMNIFESNPTITNCIFTLNAASSYGGGLFNSTASPTITKSTFSLNTSSQYGGGMYNTVSSSPTISGCTFLSNTSMYYGGGMFNEQSSSPTITQCIFSTNTTTTNSGGYGGGIYNTLSSPIINNSVFASNGSISGGGVANVAGSDSKLTNCLFTANTSDFGGGVFNLSSSPTIANCTFVANTSAYNGGGGGLYNKTFPTDLKVQNCIFWNNKKNTYNNAIGADIENLNAKVTVTNTALQLYSGAVNYPFVAGTLGFQGNGLGNLYATDPFFVVAFNPIGLDNVWGTADDGLILQNCSPAINVGNNADNVTTTDISGVVNSRIKNTTIDMGAYENQFGDMVVAITKNPTTTFICKGTSVTFTATPTNVGLAPIYDFQVNNVSIQKSIATTFTTTTLIDGDVVKVILTSNSCTATSSTITMIVHLPIPTAISNSPICAANTLNLSASSSVVGSINTYSWQGPNGYASTSQSPVFSNSTTSLSGTYTVNITDSYGCSATTSIPVTVNALPVSSSTSNSPICKGFTLNLQSSNTSAGLNNTYMWSGPNGYTSNIQNPIFLNVNTTLSGTYSVIITNSNGCTATSATPVIVNALPVPTIGSNSPICSGFTLNLTSSNTSGGLNNTYAWSGPNSYTTTNQNPSFTNSTTSLSGNYSVMVTDKNGCLATISTAVIVNALPVPTIGSNTPICAGFALNLTSSNVGLSNTYAWRGPNSYSSTDQNPTILNATTSLSGTYSVTVTDLNGCTATVSTPVIVNQLPKPTIKSNTPVCTGFALNLEATNLNSGQNNNYLWKGPNNYTSTNQNPVILNVVVSLSGTYTVTISDLNGCTATASTPVIINPLPVPSIVSNSPLCTGFSINLNSSNTSSSLNNSYSWSGPSGYTSSSQNPIINNAIVSMSGNYIVTITDANGCKAAISTQVIINPLPVPSISSNSPICTDFTLNLTASNTSSASGNNYSWRGPNSYTSTNQFPFITHTTILNSGAYNVTVTDINGCTATASTPVIVNPLPVPMIGSNTPICSGFTLNLTAANSSALIGNTYSWKGPNSYTSNNQNPNLINAKTTMSGTYIVTITDLNGCILTTSTPVTINPVPVPTIGSNTPICSGFTLNLTALNLDFPVGNTYSWKGPNGYISTNQNPDLINANTSMSGTYSLTITDLNGCTATASMPIIVNPLPIPTIGSNTPICSGLTLNLTASNTSLANGNIYSWKGPNGYISINQNPDLINVNITMSGSYSVRVTDVNGCILTTSTPVTINPVPFPTIGSNTPICSGLTLNLTGGGIGTAYAWTGANNFTSSQQNPSIVNAGVAATGNYILTVTNANGCTSAVTTSVTVNANPTATASSNSPIYAKTTLNLSGAGGGMYTWAGPSSFTSSSQNPSVTSVSTAASGIYTLTVTTNGCTNLATTSVTIYPAVIIYVNKSNTNSIQDGTNWAKSFSNLQSALTTASTILDAPVEIWVGKGTYKPTDNTDRSISFSPPPGVKMYGGFVGTETLLSQRNFRTNQTLLSGDIGRVDLLTDNSTHVLKIIDASNQTLIDGFSIKYGYAVSNSSALIPTDSSIELSSPILIESGGAIYIQNSSPTIANCIIQNNYATAGAGIYSEGNSVTNIKFCYISGNLATFGGGMYNLHSNIILSNTVISGNKALGGAIYNNNSNPTITNATISGNDGTVGGIFNDVPSIPTIKNSIIWNNSGATNLLSKITFSIVQDGFNGIGNLNLDPKFISPQSYGLAPITAGNYHVLAGSPGNDLGENGLISTTDIDLDGNLRRNAGGIVDMGAYEFNGFNIGLITSIISGNWEDITTWSLNRIPTLTDNVIININHTVTVNGIGEAKKVEYRTNAMVNFGNSNAQLKMGF